MTAEPASVSSFRRILLTGASGFVGSHLLDELPKRIAGDVEVALAGRQLYPVHGFRALEVNLADATAVMDAVRNLEPDLVIHLAAQSSVAAAQGQPAETWEVNFCGTLNLGAAISRHAPTCTLLFASTADVYGGAFRDGPASETTLPQPISSYSRSKWSAELMLADVLPASTRLIVVRPTNHIGKGQSSRFAIASFAEQIARIEAGQAPPEIRVGNLQAQRDFIDVRDVVRGYLDLLAGAEGLPMRNLFNIASGVPRSLEWMLDRLRSLSGAETSVVIEPLRLRPSEIPVAAVDASAFRTAVCWRPEIDIEDTLASVLEDKRSALTKSAGLVS